jgi:hypothetical protein
MPLLSEQLEAIRRLSSLTSVPIALRDRMPHGALGPLALAACMQPVFGWPADDSTNQRAI